MHVYVKDLKSVALIKCNHKFFDPFTVEIFYFYLNPYTAPLADFLTFSSSLS